ncbi:MAG: TIGR04282 family arsenosugar biosynthesis glycosyltransferase [Deltaproteobacteria bacterium]|nr:TIGR04282 family arsenosugar biosynthesis glycosyltransferase [Deltaproteobacteria bacterium]
MVSLGELLVFARVPVLGEGKTRLAAQIGIVATHELYRAMGAHIVRSIAESPRNFSITVVYTPSGEASREAIAAWLPWAVRYEAQREGTLGERMQHALGAAILRSNRAVVVGTDCVFVTAPLIQRALHDLDDVPCVLGPAEDGGYFYLGVNRGDLPIFNEIPWSTEVVFSETMARLREANLRAVIAPKERDVDTLEDLVAIAEDPRVRAQPELFRAVCDALAAAPK